MSEKRAANLFPPEPPEERRARLTKSTSYDWIVLVYKSISSTRWKEQDAREAVVHTIPHWPVLWLFPP